MYNMRHAINSNVHNANSGQCTVCDPPSEARKLNFSVNKWWHDDQNSDRSRLLEGAADHQDLSRLCVFVHEEEGGRECPCTV